ncbi:MAG: hypothetical protein ABJB10_05375 [Mesorhizobium sp.]
MWEAAATATALLHGVIDLRRHDELPRILIEQPDDRLLDLLLSDDVAMADQHRFALAGGALLRAVWLVPAST